MPLIETYTTTEENAAKIMGWLRERGGIALWISADLSDPSASWTTPAHDVHGEPATKPTWKAGPVPTIITDPAKVLVSVDREVKRFRIGVRRGSQGLSFKVTDGGNRRIRRALAKAGDNSYYLFDYDNQEAVIMKSDKLVPLEEYLTQKTLELPKPIGLHLVSKTGGTE